MKNIKIALLLCSALALPSCTAIGVAAGAGATVGIAAAQEGGVSRAVDDARIQLEINDLWFRYSVEAFRKLDMTVDQGRVLVTGVVQNPEHRVEAVRLAWQPEGVEQVINEIQVADSEGILGYAKDAWISTSLRTQLTFDRNVLSINYNIDTVQGTVYLMGFAQSRAELNRVIERARSISGVKGVVSYVKIISGEAQPGDVPADTSGNAMGAEPSQGSAPVFEEAQPTDITAQPPASNAPPPVETYEPQSLNGADQNAGPPRQRQGIESEEIQWNR